MPFHHRRAGGSEFSHLQSAIGVIPKRTREGSRAGGSRSTPRFLGRLGSLGMTSVVSSRPKLGSRFSRGSGAFARHDLVVLALADAAQRVVLPQRVAAVAVPREDAAEIGVADEDQTVHVVDLALHP